MHFRLILVIDGWGICCKIALGWLPLNHICDKSTLVQVMAWCHQATSHYRNQCWPRSPTPNGVARPQWVNTWRPEQNGCHFADNIFKCIILQEKFLFCFKFHWSLFLRVQLIISQCWLRLWLDADHVCAKPLPEPMMTKFHDAMSLVHNELTHWPLGNLNEIFDI